MNLYYMQSRNEIINFDHVIRAKFEPGYLRPAGTDEESLQPYPEQYIRAKLSLTLTELDLEQDCAYGGDVNGVASKSQLLSLFDVEAECLFELLKTHAVHVPQLPNKEEQK